MNEEIEIRPGGICIPLNAETIGFFAGEIKRIGTGRYYVITDHNQLVSPQQKEALMKIWPTGF